MKKALKHSGLILLTAIYCFALSLVGNSSYHNGFDGNFGNKEQKYSLNASSNIFWHTSETSVNSQSKIPVVGFKNLIDDYNTIITSKGQFLKTCFSHFERSSISFLINLRNSELLFPFHTFW